MDGEENPYSRQAMQQMFWLVGKYRTLSYHFFGRLVVCFWNSFQGAPAGVRHQVFKQLKSHCARTTKVASRQESPCYLNFYWVQKVWPVLSLSVTSFSCMTWLGRVFFCLDQLTNDIPFLYVIPNKHAEIFWRTEFFQMMHTSIVHPPWWLFRERPTSDSKNHELVQLLSMICSQQFRYNGLAKMVGRNNALSSVR